MKKLLFVTVLVLIAALLNDHIGTWFLTPLFGVPLQDFDLFASDIRNISIPGTLMAITVTIMSAYRLGIRFVNNSDFIFTDEGVINGLMLTVSILLSVITKNPLHAAACLVIYLLSFCVGSILRSIHHRKKSQYMF